MVLQLMRLVTASAETESGPAKVLVAVVVETESELTLSAPEIDPPDDGK